MTPEEKIARVAKVHTFRPKAAVTGAAVLHDVYGFLGKFVAIPQKRRTSRTSFGLPIAT